MKTLATILLAVPLLAPIALAASVFDKPELRTTASPGEARQITLPAGVRVVDSDVSPAGPTAALLVLQTAGTREILFWDVRQAQTTKGWDVPAGFTARSLVWHPEGNALFVAGAQGTKYVICKVEGRRQMDGAADLQFRAGDSPPGGDGQRSEARYDRTHGRFRHLGRLPSRSRRGCVGCAQGSLRHLRLLGQS